MRRILLVVGYAVCCGQCRRKYLLNYFGEVYEKASCATCDICRNTCKTVGMELDDNEKSILKTVYYNTGSMGRRKLALLLKGSYELDEKYRDYDEFGVLNNLSETDIRSRITKLTRSGYVYTDDSAYPTVHISEKGKAMLVKHST